MSSNMTEKTGLEITFCRQRLPNETLLTSTELKAILLPGGLVFQRVCAAVAHGGLKHGSKYANMCQPKEPQIGDGNLQDLASHTFTEANPFDIF